MVAFGDFWAINPPKVEVTVTVKVEVKGVLKDEVKRVLRAPEAACVVNLFEDSGKASVWGSQQLVTRFKGTAVPESGHQEKPDRRLSGVDCQEKHSSDGEGLLMFPCCTKCVPSGRKPGRKQGGK